MVIIIVIIIHVQKVDNYSETWKEPHVMLEWMELTLSKDPEQALHGACNKGQGEGRVQ